MSDGFVCIPAELSQSALERVLGVARGRESELLDAARERVAAWSWRKEQMHADRFQPLFAERFHDRTPPERPGDPDGPAIRVGRDRDGLVAFVDLGGMTALGADRGLRFEAWHTASEAVLLDEQLQVFGAQARLIEHGRVRAFARLTAPEGRLHDSKWRATTTTKRAASPGSAARVPPRGLIPMCR